MIFTTLDLARKVAALYQDGLPCGSLTGWPSLDKFYTVQPGQVTVVTGIPSHGKSELLDALMVNLIPKWVFCVFSPENFPHELHIAKLIEKYTGQPFGVGPRERLGPDKLNAAMSELDRSFGFFKPRPGLQIADMAAVLSDAGRWLEARRGDRHCGLVVDPWNELEHQRPAHMSETEYISEVLSTVRQWAREFEVHVWIVAHPMKLQKDQRGSYPVPTPYDISGSAHWRNKADNCLAVWRDVKADDGLVQVHVQKVRFKNIGKPGVVDLKYDRATGRYSEVASPVDIERYRRVSGGDD